MAFTATSRGVPFRSMSPRTAWASALRAAQERTFSLRLMRSSKLGFTSREITEATAVAWRTVSPPTIRRARQAAASQGTKRRLRRFLSPHNFYLTDQGLVFFYPMYALGGSITEFLLPYREEGSPEV